MALLWIVNLVVLNIVSVFFQPPPRQSGGETSERIAVHFRVPRWGRETYGTLEIPDISTVLRRFSIERFGTRYRPETRESTH